ncbi:hypothetical protein MMC34_004117 [Xylographa carneopallida]|nr:hypothetical protein [Xylographa carneopallida]
MLSYASSFKRYDVLILFLILILVWQVAHFIPSGSYRLPNFRDIVKHVGQHDPVDWTAGNATLGFQAIISVSAENRNDAHAWRQDGLINAANRTGLIVHIPHQRDVTFKELKDLRDGEVDVDGDGEADEDIRHPSEGQALAWLAHIDTLKNIIKANTTTALIIEDDADWDVSIRSETFPIASAIRSLTNASSPPDLYPYGTDWDVLWLGHCGDIYGSASPPSIQFSDPSVLPTNLLRNVWIGATYDAFPNHTRNVHYAGGPMCTFAYAVTLHGAKKLKRWASTTGEAFDVKMHRGCVDGALRCLTATPELMHHQRMLGAQSLSSEGVGGGESEPAYGEHGGGGARSGRVDELAGSGVTLRGHRVFTHNIMHSARCNWDRGDDELVQCLPNEEEWERFQT